VTRHLGVKRALLVGPLVRAVVSQHEPAREEGAPGRGHRPREHGSRDTYRRHHGLRRQELAEEPMVLALPPRHRLARRKTIELADLADEPWIAPSRDGLVVRTCRAAGFEPRIAFLSSDPLAIRALIVSGLAVTLTSRLLAGQLHGVQIAAVPGEPARRAIYALLPDSGARPVDRAMLRELETAATSARKRPLPSGTRA